MYCITKIDIERYYKYLFMPTSILKCNLCQDCGLSFLKAVIIIIFCQILIFVFVLLLFCVFEEAGSPSPPFLISLESEVSDPDICSALIKDLIWGNLFHIHGSYGAIFFINRYMYFCVVAFINDTITLSFSCLPLNFSFLQIYIKIGLLCVIFLHIPSSAFVSHLKANFWKYSLETLIPFSKGWHSVLDYWMRVYLLGHHWFPLISIWYTNQIAEAEIKCSLLNIIFAFIVRITHFLHGISAINADLHSANGNVYGCWDRKTILHINQLSSLWQNVHSELFCLPIIPRGPT